MRRSERDMLAVSSMSLDKTLCSYLQASMASGLLDSAMQGNGYCLNNMLHGRNTLCCSSKQIGHAVANVVQASRHLTPQL